MFSKNAMNKIVLHTSYDRRQKEVGSLQTMSHTTIVHYFTN